MNIGVIGGADGPTTIFIGGQPDWTLIALAAVCAAAAVLIVRAVRRRQR